MRKINYEKDPRDAEIAKLKAQVQTIGESKMNSIVVNLGQGTTASFNKADICDLVSENVRLKAELEALRPKPVVEVRYIDIGLNFTPRKLSESQYESDNLKLTFHDGVLVDAKVIRNG